MANRKQLKRQSLFRQLADGVLQYFKGVKMTLWPNDEQSEIWFADDKGRVGFAITVSGGSRGLSLRVRRFAGSGPLTTTGNLAPDSAVMPQVDAEEVSITMYYHDAKSQAFKRWYGLDGRSDNDESEGTKKAYALGVASARKGDDESCISQYRAILGSNPMDTEQEIIDRHVNAFERGYWATIAGI